MTTEHPRNSEEAPPNKPNPQENPSGSSQDQSEILASVSAYLLIVAGELLQQDQLLAGRIQASDLVQETFAGILSDPQFGDLSRSQQFDGLDVDKLTTRMWLKLNELGRKVRAAKRNAQREQPLPLRDSDSDKPLGPSPDDSSSSDAQDSAEPKLPSSSGPERKAMQSEDIATTLTALGKLPPDYQKVIQMHSLQQMSFAEIAPHMDRSEDAVKKLWQRAMAKLQQHLREP